RREWGGEGHHQRRRFRQGVPLHLVGRRTPQPRDQVGPARRRVRIIRKAAPSHATAAATSIQCAAGAVAGGAAGKSTTMLAPASLSSRWKSGESRMIFPAAARRRSTASGGNTKDVGRSFR